MPKKMGTNSKADEARSKKAEADSERKDKEAREKEDRYWQEMEGPKSKASKRREEEAEKRAELLAKKAEAKRLAEKEEREMEGYGKKVDKKALRVGVPKVTAAQLAKQQEDERSKLEAQAGVVKRRELRATNEEEYERMVAVENVNRSEDLIEARSVESALAQMAVAEELPLDRHPEKRAKASYKAFEEAELANLKQEKPGLSLTQYREMIWKLWKKSPDNPLNQAAAAAATNSGN